MPGLREQLQQCFQGRVCLMGLGNVDYGDDGFGVRMAERVMSEVRASHVAGGPADWGLRAGGCGPECVVAGTTPERVIGRVTEQGFDHVIFMDAVDFGGVPGSAIFLDSEQMSCRYPQISTHKVSLGLLAKWAESNRTTRVWLLGVQPESLRAGERLSPALQATLEVLLELLKDVSRGALV